MTVILSAIEYTVSVEDRQVVFRRNDCFGSCCFVFERPHDINDSPGIWYLVHLEASSDQVPVSHILNAAEWADSHFGKSFEPYKGQLV